MCRRAYYIAPMPVSDTIEGLDKHQVNLLLWFNELGIDNEGIK